MNSFEQGEDIYREILLTIGGVAADTANFLTITCKVVHELPNVQIGSYSFAAGTIKKNLPTNEGKISFIISKTENNIANPGIYQHEIETTETDADYEDSVRYRKLIGNCFRLKKKK